MRKITQDFKTATQPIVIEFSGRDAELLLCLLGSMTFKSLEESLSKSVIAKGYSVTADEVDGMTDELFEMVDNHVRGAQR